MKKYFGVLSILAIMIFALLFMVFSENKAMAKSDLPEQAQARAANAIILYIGSNDAYVNNMKTSVDKENSDVTPVSIEGRTIVPVRFISESLGAKVEWNQKASTVTISYKGKTIKLGIDKKEISINNKKSSLEVAACRINNRTFVPFRAIAEALGKKVFYDNGLIIISDKENIFNPKTERTLLNGIIAKVNNLPVLGSEAKLKELLKYDNSNRYIKYDFAAKGMIRNAAMDTAASMTNNMQAEQSAAKEAKSSTDYSKTNVQVEGVDEADIIKTDGKYIYQVNNRRIIIAEVYPSEKMKITSKVEFTDGNFNPAELYIDNKKMIVIGTTYEEKKYPYNNYSTSDIPKMMSGSYQPQYYRISTNYLKAIVYDISDKENVKKLRDFQIEGSYVSSRRIGSALYLVSNKYVDFYYYGDNVKEELTPKYYDSSSEDGTKYLDYKDIRYFPGCYSPNYLVIAGINLDDLEQPANINSYLGTSNNIYCSENNLYVAATGYNIVPVVRLMNGTSSVMPQNRREESTDVYKFALDKSKVTYIGKGNVPGRILNQFSMDENDGYFRIATTKGYSGGTGEYEAKNNLYVLNDVLSMTGRIEDIAPGETIYSVRFMGSRAYMVTFKNTDPLFVIDLKNPSNPKILGKLKIPGYSNYIHPYDENHIIGFGKDAVDSKDVNFAWYQGMKIALFDVTDVENPKEMFKEIIGDRGTDSDLLRNHKALLFSKEKNLLAFPVTLMEISAKEKKSIENNASAYGEFAFQGAYIYNLDLKNGFKLKGRISHLSDDEYLKAGNRWYNSRKNVERIIYIDDVLYTLSNGMIKANDIQTLKEKDSLTID